MDVTNFSYSSAFFINMSSVRRKVIVSTEQNLQTLDKGQTMQKVAWQYGVLVLMWVKLKSGVLPELEMKAWKK
jgi:hypothetical protein